MQLAKINEWLEADKLVLLQGWARTGLTNEQIANNIGIDVATLYRWKKDNDKICNALKEGREVTDFQVENALYQNALNGNVTAQIFWLKNRKKNEWREKIELPTNPEQLNKVQELLNKIKDEANEDTK